MALFTCPCCNARFPIEAALEDLAARKAVTAAFKFPAPLGGLLVSYVGMFRPRKNALSWRRFTKLLNELLEPIQAAELTRNGMTWAAPQDYWKEAFEIVLNKRESLSLPLTSHGYLFEIVVRLSSKAAGKEEEREENDRQHQSRMRGNSEPRSIAEIMEDTHRKEWDKDLHRRAGKQVSDDGTVKSE